MQRIHDEMMFTAAEHVQLLTKCEGSYHIKGKELAPLGHISGLASSLQRTPLAYLEAEILYERMHHGLKLFDIPSVELRGGKSSLKPMVTLVNRGQRAPGMFLGHHWQICLGLLYVLSISIYV